MRLTLRTLLAWMDGVLPPVVAAELTGKVEASPAAQTLADRIRGLLAREATTPPPAGPDLASEINAVAEYLDNVLDPGTLADFERDCLASDARLAEVAACHRLLAEYAATSAPATPRLEEPPAPDPARPLRPVVVAEPRPAPWASWLLATVATLLLVVLAGLFGWSVVRDRNRLPLPQVEDFAAAPAGPRAVQPSPEPRGPQPPRDAPIEPAPEPVAPVAPVPDAPVPVAQVPDAQTPDGPTPDAQASAEASAPVLSDPAPAPAPGQPLAIGVSVPFGDALAIAARKPAPPADGPAAADGSVTPTMTPAETAPEAAPPTDESPAAAPLLHVVAGPPLLHHAANVDATPVWLAAPVGHTAPLPADVVAAGLTGGGTVVTVGGLQLSLRPGSHVVFSKPAGASPRINAAPLHIEVLFGAVAIAGKGSVLIMAGDLAGIATVGPGGPLGVEVQLAIPTGADPATSPASHTAQLFTATAPVGWRQTDAEGGPPELPLAGLPAEGPLPPRSRVTWTDRDPAAATVEAAGGVPSWVTGGWPADRLERAVASELTARLAADRPVAETLEMLAGSPREEVRVAAAATLATLGDYRPLVRLLCGENPPDALREGRWQEFEAATVPLALARGPNSAAALGGSFATEGPAGRGADLLRLARGFTDDDLAAGADAWLVLALDDPRLVIRRYAIKNLHEISGVDRADRLRYRADRDAGLRKDGVTWWRSRQEQGLVGRRPGAAPPRP